jgi:hypothetical protein
LRGRGRHPQPAAFVAEDHPGRRHVEQLDTPFGEHVQELQDVEVIDQRVGQLDEGARHRLLPTDHGRARPRRYLRLPLSHIVPPPFATQR